MFSMRKSLYHNSVIWVMTKYRIIYYKENIYKMQSKSTVFTETLYMLQQNLNMHIIQY